MSFRLNSVAAAAPLFPLLLTLFVIFQLPSYTQDARGSIIGTITDPTGARIPNANVTVVNKAMGAPIKLTTNNSGVYTATYLIPGVYEVRVENQGFKKAVRGNIELRVNDRLEIDVQDRKSVV